MLGSLSFERGREEAKAQAQKQLGADLKSLKAQVFHMLKSVDLSSDWLAWLAFVEDGVIEKLHSLGSSVGGHGVEGKELASTC